MQYVIRPAELPPHGLTDPYAPILTLLGFELFIREGIKLRSLGIHDSEDEAKATARRHAGEEVAEFL